MKLLWFGCGAIFGFTLLSITFASVPPARSTDTMKVTDDTAIYQQLSEITVPKQGKINFDQDIARLSADEPRYRENLPHLHSSIRAPMKRIAQRKYKYRGKQAPTASR